MDPFEKGSPPPRTPFPQNFQRIQLPLLAGNPLIQGWVTFFIIRCGTPLRGMGVPKNVLDPFSLSAYDTVEQGRKLLNDVVVLLTGGGKTLNEDA